MKRLTTNEFIDKAKLVHGDKYDYSNIIYESAHKLVTIICPIHGGFKQSPNNHIYGFGCIKCGYLKTGSAQSLKQNEVISQFINKHNNKYKYSLVDYSGD